MKKIFIFALSLVITTGINAQTISPKVAAQKAASLFQTASGAKGMKAAASAEPELANVTTLGNDTCYYVFNNPQGGYAIIGGDAAAKDVLAYSDNGSFRYDNLPDAAKELLSEYAHDIAAAKASGHMEATAVTSVGSKDISPICPVQWDQSAPWNQDIPTLPNNTVFGDEAGKTAAVGCVAVATAQVLYTLSTKFSMPTSVKADIKKKLSFVDVDNEDAFVSYTNELTFLKSETIKWSDMTNEDGKSASRLMLLAGLLSDMGYGKESGTTEDKVRDGLIRDLGLTCTFEQKKETGDTDTQWETKVYNELSQGRPIIYGAEAQYIGKGGHCFVIDGYKVSGNLFHVNWGWGGSGDDYFALTATSATPLPGGAAWGSDTDKKNTGEGSWMNPQGQGTGASEGDYRAGHDMVYGIVFQPTATSTGATITDGDDEQSNNAKASVATAVPAYTTIDTGGTMKITFDGDGAQNTGNDINMVWGVELVPLDENGAEIDGADGLLLSEDGTKSVASNFAAGSYKQSYTIDLSEYDWGTGNDAIPYGNYSVTPCMFYDGDNDNDYVDDEQFSYVSMPTGWVAPKVSLTQPTAINNVDANTSTSSAQAQGKTVKVIRKNRIIINKGDKQYNTAGQQIN